MTRLTMRAAVLCLLAGATPATTFERLTTLDLVHLAERVCCVRCESVETRLDPASGLVFTHARFVVLEDMKGRGEGSILELRVVGGEANGVRTVVAGMPAFRRGGECVLLLGKRNRGGYPVVVAAARGTIGVRRTKKGERYLARSVDGFADLPNDARVGVADFSDAVKRAVRKRERERTTRR